MRRIDRRRPFAAFALFRATAKALRMTVLSEALAYNARTRGSDIAIDSGNGETLTWTDLQFRVAQSSKSFAAQFGGSGRAVATAFETGVTSVISDLALLEAGIAAIPLPGFSPPNSATTRWRRQARRPFFLVGVNQRSSDLN